VLISPETGSDSFSSDRFSQKFKAFVFVDIHGSATFALGMSITGMDFYKLEDFQLYPDRA